MPIDIDFETRSRCDIGSSGAWKYSRDPSTQILCMAYKLPNEETKLWVPGKDAVPVWVTNLELIKSYGGLRAHNASFEQAIWANIMVALFKAAKVPVSLWHDTMASCATATMPLSLGDSAAALKLKVQKDEEGRRVMLQLSQPRRPSQDNPKSWWEPEDVPEKFTSLYSYCINDVDTQVGLAEELPTLSDDERKVWELDQTINQRGIRVDIALAHRCTKLIEEYTSRKAKIASELTGGVSVAQVGKLRDWINAQGLPVADLTKGTITKLLTNDNVPKNVREVLNIRQSLGKASVKKIDAMLACADTDGRVRYTAVYHGAGTGRWAGRLIQPQNFARGVIDKDKHGFDMDEAISYLETKTLDELLDIFETAGLDFMDVVSSCLRGFICASDGKTFVQADYSNIEGRILAWLAGEEWKVNAFSEFDTFIYNEKGEKKRKGADLYILSYCNAFNVDINSVDWKSPYGKQLRQIGKVMELALGYGGGVGAFRTMAKGYGVSLRPNFQSIWEHATEKERSSAIRMLNLCEQKNKELHNYVFDPEEFDSYDAFREEFLACEITKQKWRKAHTNVTQLWADCERAAMDAVLKPNERQYVRSIYYLYDGKYLYCVLPSGRKLYYPEPKVKLTEVIGWDGRKQTKRSLTYAGVNSVTRKWVRNNSYGGHLVENIVQAIARDCLVAGMFEAEKEGYEIVMTVHDEIVTEVNANDNTKSVSHFEKVITRMPKWADGLPLAAEGWTAKRYRK